MVTLVMILSIMMSYLLMMKVVAVTDGRGTGSETLSQ